MSLSYLTGPGDIIHLNVGGERFSTSKQTLSWMPDTFFTSLLSGRISTLRDDTGAIFIDRDPALFRWILQYLRTREIATKGYDIAELKHEAEFYGVSGLVKRLSLCQDLASSSCGDVLFCGYLAPPSTPIQEPSVSTTSRPTIPSVPPASSRFGPSHTRTPSQEYRLLPHHQSSSCAADGSSPSTIAGLRAGGSNGALPANPAAGGSSTAAADAGGGDYRRSHSRTPSLDFRQQHSRNSSADLNKLFKIEIGVLNNVGGSGSCWVDPLRVRMVKAHHNWIVVAYAHFVTCYRNKDSTGWQLAFTSPHQEQLIERVAINAKMSAAGQQQQAAAAEPPGGGGGAAAAHNKMLAIAYGSNIKLWSVGDDGSRLDVGTFHLGVSVEYLFFIGYQLVALSSVGKIGVWHAMTRNWQTQDVLPVASFDTAGSFLLLGCTNGSIYYIDMQKFPLRMKDNDLLVTELYHDPSNDVITAISVYLTPKTNVCGNWIEIAYGTSSGTVRVIVQHPETVGHGPQLFQTFTVHRHPVTKVRLSEKLLISVCSEYNHVRTWSVMRFRGMISTQPGSTPLSSYKILTLEEADQPVLCAPHANEIGPYGEQDDEQVFIQKVVPETDQLMVRLASRGKRVCVVKSVDGSSISGFCVHECDGRIGSTRPRRYLFTGHTSGAIQMWDLTTALDMTNKPQPSEDGSPEPCELLRMLESCELSYSYGTTPCVSPSPHSTAMLHHSQQLHNSLGCSALHHTAAASFTSQYQQPHINASVPPQPPVYSQTHYNNGGQQQLVHHASQACTGSSSTQGSSPPQAPSSSSCSMAPVVSAGHRRNNSNGSGSYQQPTSTTSDAVGTSVQSSVGRGATASRMMSQACQTPDNSSTHPDALQDQLLAALGSDNLRSTPSSRERQSPGGAVFGGSSSGVCASFKLSSSPPHRPHLPTHSKTSNASLLESGSSGGCRNTQSIACSDASISSSNIRSSDSFPAVGVGTEAHTTSNDHPLNVVSHSMSGAHCSPINRGVASSGQSLSPSCSTGRGPPLSTGHLLKPSNVAFLSHHQTGVRKSSRDDLHDDEGTPC